MTPDQQLEAIQEMLREFVADHQELASRPQGVLGILRDIPTIEAFLTWCVTKRYLADVPGEAVLIALDRLQWDAQHDAILHVWKAEHPEMANTAYESGSPEALEYMRAFVQWKITRGYTDLRSGERLLSSLQQALDRSRFEP